MISKSAKKLSGFLWILLKRISPQRRVLKIKNKHRLKEVSINELSKAIHNLHGRKAVWVESVPVKETFQGETVWEGVVQVFDLLDHPTAKRCYAWSHGLDNSKKRRFYAVLHQPPVDSPQAAVRAAIVKEFKG